MNDSVSIANQINESTDIVSRLTNIIGKQLSNLIDKINEWTAGVPSKVIPNSTASVEIQPNVLYIFTNRTSNLNITLASPIEGQVNEYHFMVYIGGTVPTITLPPTVDFGGDLTKVIEANRMYEFSILENDGIICRW